MYLVRTGNVQPYFREIDTCKYPKNVKISEKKINVKLDGKLYIKIKKLTQQGACDTLGKVPREQN